MERQVLYLLQILLGNRISIDVAYYQRVDIVTYVECYVLVHVMVPLKDKKYSNSIAKVVTK